MRVNKLLKCLIIIGIGLRVVLWCCQSSPQGDDGMRYLREGINMVEHRVFSTVNSENPPPSAHDMPLWPSIMAVVYWFSNSVKATQYIAGMINIVLVLGSVMLLVSMLRHKPLLFNDKQIAISVGLLLFLPDSIIYSLFHMPDQLAVFAVIVALWFYFRGGADDWRYFIGAAFAFVVSIYTKPICLPLTVAFIAAIPFVAHTSWKNRLLIVVVGIGIVSLGLCPWIYGCNWGRLVDTLPDSEKNTVMADMLRFDSEIAGYDLMKRSQMQGDYAKRKILAHLPEYCIYTAKKHPRLYAGTGTVALLRYLGLERTCDALDAMWGSNNARGYAPVYEKPYTFTEKVLGGGLQIVSWGVLMIGYIVVVIGIFKGLRNALLLRDESRRERIMVVLCPILSLLLLAVVIGPITNTRYRFIMIPFLAMLSGYAVKNRQS